MKTDPKNVLLILIVLVAVGFWGYHKLSEYKAGKLREEQQNEQQAAINKTITEFKERYGATTDWEEKLRGSFSLELEDAFTNSSAILISGHVEDVARKSNKFELHVHNWRLNVHDYLYHAYNVKFILDCDSELARRVVSHKSDFLEYAIVARITSVEKPVFRLKSGNKTTEDEVEIEVDLPGLIIVRGRCLDALPVSRSLLLSLQ
ncbi:MAG TPA: hypothetical protein VKC60_03940 [Opitutaceae bacterium]|nr:hypothetical protein [Opitutaceae bacterium]